MEWKWPVTWEKNGHTLSLILITTFNNFLQVDIFVGSSDGGWNRIPGGHLNIKMPSYQYRDSHVKDKTVLPTVSSLTWESPYLGKTVFILRRGPYYLCSFYWNFTTLHTGGLPHSSTPCVSQHYLVWYPYTDIATDLFFFIGQFNLIHLTTWYKCICRCVCVVVVVVVVMGGGGGTHC